MVVPERRKLLDLSLVFASSFRPVEVRIESGVQLSYVTQSTQEALISSGFP